MIRIAISICLAACSRSSSAPTAPPVAAPVDAAPQTRQEQILQQLERFADEVCRCPDHACATRAKADMDAWLENETKADAQQTKFTQADSDRAAAAARRMGACLKQTRAGSATP